jgi:hypothetical protein
MLDRKKKAPAQPVEKPSRQVLRQLARRRRKQPVDVPQTVWHGINDMPKIGIGPRPAILKAKGSFGRRIISSVTKVVNGVKREIVRHATKGERSYRA